MFKKILSLCLAVLMIATMCVSFASCGDGNADGELQVEKMEKEKALNLFF